MPLKNFMHPRNKYRDVPNVRRLALRYPEFRKNVYTDLCGKVRVDFTDVNAVRGLSQMLLKHDFNLEVKIPEDKLVPTLPLRLNYVLWIEDLMNHCSLTEMKNAIGLDIGTGAVCIYALLFANMYKTRMKGTEISETSVQTAMEHVTQNNYQDLIQIIQVTGESILKGVLKETEVCHFSMCNPPFFDVDKAARLEKKLPPRNAFTGQEEELTVAGGERAFVVKMIEESIEMQEQIKIYTTMLGMKSTLFSVIKFMKMHNIENLTWTEFCQGYTKRWGLAWTFLPKNTYDLTTAPVIREKYGSVGKLLKQHRPVEIAFPLGKVFASFDEFVHTMQEIIKELNLDIRELKRSSNANRWNCQLTAKADTWTHARRKRRLARKEANESKKQNEKPKEDVNNKNDLEGIKEQEEISCEESTDDRTKNPLLVCTLSAEFVKNDSEPENSMLNMCMVFDQGNGGKNALITLREYLLNRLKVRDLVRSCEKGRKRKNDEQRLDVDEPNVKKLARVEDSSNESNEDSC